MELNFSDYPIVDSNIIIDFSLVKQFNNLLRFEGNIIVADKVKQEIERKYSSNKYSFILENLDNNIIMVTHKNFSNKQMEAMKKTLLNFKIKNCIGTKFLAKDYGEFASAIYAVYLGIKLMLTNDKKFIEKYGDEYAFRELDIKDELFILEKMFKGKEKIKITRKIQELNDKMNYELDKVAEEKNDSKMDELLVMLQSKFNC